MATAASTGTVYDALAAELAGLGIRSAFGLMGEDTAGLVTALIDSQGVEFVTTRHESAAVMAADGYAWASGEVGVAVLSHGPGFVNGLTAATTAVKSERPVLIVAGDDAHATGMKPELKQTDQETIATACGLAYFRPGSAAEAVDSLRAAVASAQARRPAVFAVPVDVLNSKLDSAPSPAPSPEPAPAPSAVGAARDEDVQRIVALLAAAKRPLILAGRGGIGAKDVLEQLAERTGALVGTSLLAKDLFRGHRLDLGMVGGWASDAARPLLDEFDLVLVFGASLTSFTMAFGNLFQEVPIVQIDVDPSHLGANHPVQLGVVGEARATAEKLLEALPEAPTEPELHRPETLERISQPLYLGDDESTEDEIDPRTLVTILDELLPADRTMITDGGHFMGFPGMYMRGGGPDRFRITAAFASIGLGLGTAIGAAVARPDQPTILFAGDGGLMMSVGDLETLARYRIPLTVIVMDDRALGAERHFLDLMGVSHEHSVYGDVDFAAVARAFGIESATVRTAADVRALAPKLSQTRSEPLLVDCKIRGDLRARWLEEIG